MDNADSARRYTRDAPLTGSNATHVPPIILYPVSRLTRRKLSFAEAILMICQRTLIHIVRRAGRYS